MKYVVIFLLANTVGVALIVLVGDALYEKGRTFGAKLRNKARSSDGK